MVRNLTSLRLDPSIKDLMIWKSSKKGFDEALLQMTALERLTLSDLTNQSSSADWLGNLRFASR
jgi:hypothetical protein